LIPAIPGMTSLGHEWQDLAVMQSYA
jgi:hypothetical protein